MSETAVRPTPERLAKGDGVIIPATDRHNPQDRPALVVRQTSLDRYKARKTLEPHQLEAAFKFQEHTIRSRRFPSPCMAFEGRVSGGVPELQDGAVAAGIARDRAIKFLQGVNYYYALVVQDVCVEGLAAEAWAIALRLHPMKGIKTLRLALDALAKHYGIRVT